MTSASMPKSFSAAFSTSGGYAGAATLVACGSVEVPLHAATIIVNALIRATANTRRMPHLPPAEIQDKLNLNCILRVSSAKARYAAHVSSPATPVGAVLTRERFRRGSGLPCPSHAVSQGAHPECLLRRVGVLTLPRCAILALVRRDAACPARGAMGAVSPLVAQNRLPSALFVGASSANLRLLAFSYRRGAFSLAVFS